MGIFRGYFPNRAECAVCEVAAPPFTDGREGAVAQGWVTLRTKKLRHIADVCPECAPTFAEIPRQTIRYAEGV